VTAGYIHMVDTALIAAADKICRAIWQAMTGESSVVVEFRTQRS
jgi:hypothetical protein